MKLITSILFIIILFVSSQLIAQKVIQKQLDGSQITTVSVSGDTMFKIEASTKKTREINLILKVEGENFEQIILESQIKNDTLFIGSAYQPLFIPPDDKLSVHKKISIELTMVIPIGLRVNICSDIASVFANGIFRNVMVELINGHFSSNNFTGNLLVNTVYGNITLRTNAGKISAESKNGSVKQDKIINGNNRISLNSVNGNISVAKTQ